MSTKHYIGHRSRLREQFKTAPNSLADYEIMELILGYVIKRADVKPRAKELIEKIGGLKNIFTSKLTVVEGVGAETETFIKLLRELVVRSELDNIGGDDLKLTNASLIYQYLKYKIGLSLKEEFLLVTLNIRYKLIAVDVISTGTINQAVVFVREVVEKALERKASKVIIAHNHPSGEFTPSSSDDIVTTKISNGLKSVDIEMLDHIIITKTDFFSYRTAQRL